MQSNTATVELLCFHFHLLTPPFFAAAFMLLHTLFPCPRYEQPSVPQSVTAYLVRAVEELADAASSDNENLALAYVMMLHKSVLQRSQRIPALTSMLQASSAAMLVLTLLLFPCVLLPFPSIICWFGRLQIAESEFYPLIASFLCEVSRALSGARRNAEGASGLVGAALHMVPWLTHSCCFLFPLFSCTQLLNHKRNSKIQFFALLTLGSIVRTHARHDANTCASLTSWLVELCFSAAHHIAFAVFPPVR